MRRIALTAALLLTSAAAVADEPLVLRSAFDSYFRIGVAIGTRELSNPDDPALALAAHQFNAATPENCLKWQFVHPAPDRYEFELADRFVDWAEAHDMFVVGHTLIWHSQTPRWVSRGQDGKPVDREAALGRMKDHIDTVVSRYKGRVKGWDVVNEGIGDDGRLRSSDGASDSGGRPFRPWYAVIGDDFVEKAFEYAHAADPSAELYYNDYNEWHPAKIRAISDLVKRLQSKKIRIDGIGLQGHWGLDYPTLEEIDHMLTEYGKLDIKLMVTELDITVLPAARAQTGAGVDRRVSGSERLNPYRNGLPDAVEKSLADRYAAIFRLFAKHADKLDRVTFWGIHDGQSWRNNFPVRGRTDYPLLFDRNLKPKPALAAVLKAISK